jgi:biopolymer transport protein ExbB/TolQ
MQNGNSIDAQALDLMLRAGSRWVLWLLLGLSVAAVAVVLERLWFFARERRPRGHLATMLAALGRSGTAAALTALAGTRSMEVAVARACLEHAADGPAAIEEQVAATLERERLRYERGLAFLGTLGNNAPFIGLFGTVLGVIRAFAELASHPGAAGAGSVMAGISDALIATAVGLFVALPAVVMFNLYQRWLRRSSQRASALGHAAVASLRATPGER